MIEAMDLLLEPNVNVGLLYPALGFVLTPMNIGAATVQDRAVADDARILNAIFLSYSHEKEAAAWLGRRFQITNAPLVGTWKLRSITFIGKSRIFRIPANQVG